MGETRWPPRPRRKAEFGFFAMGYVEPWWKVLRSLALKGRRFEG
jgi:hypothetical protein